MTGFYGPDLAMVHADGYEATARHGARYVVEALGVRGIRTGTIVDLGCGSGASSLIFTEAGFDVVGIDVSAPMIDIARHRNPGATFIVGDMHDVELPQAVAVVSFSECLAYVLEEGDHERALQPLLRRIRHILEPGGLFVFDMLDETVHAGSDRNIRFVETEASSIVIEATRTGSRLTRDITLFRKAEALGASYRRTKETHVQMLYDPVAIMAMSTKEGFEVRMGASYGGHPLRPGGFMLECIAV